MKVTTLETRFTEQDLQVFTGALEKVSFFANEFILQAGQTESYIYFLVEGVVKAFVKKNGKAVCVDFASEMAIFCSFVSYLTQQPSHLSIQALSPVTAYRIHYDMVTATHYISKEHRRFRQQLAEACYMKCFERRVAFAELDAQERYQALLERKPAWLPRIPVEDLATYLRTSSERLSRIQQRRDET